MAESSTAMSAPLSSPAAPAVQEGSASNMSSPLSDVEEKDGDSDIMDLDVPRENPGSTGDGARADTATSFVREESDADDGEDDDDVDDDDDDSNLSEIDTNESEAETERLYDSPSKSKASSNSSAAHADRGSRESGDVREREVQNSPSKISQQSRASGGSIVIGNDAGSTPEKDQQSDSESSHSPAVRKTAHETPYTDQTQPKSPGVRKLASHTSERDDVSSDTGMNLPSNIRKRKRSPAAESMEAGHPVRKRIGSVATATDGIDDMATVGSTADDGDATPVNMQSGEHSEDEAPSSVQTAKPESVGPTRSKRSAVKKEKQSRGGDDGDPGHIEDSPGPGAGDEGAFEGEDDHAEADPDADPEGAEADAEVDIEHDGDMASHKDEEELGRRKAAQEFILELEKSFAEFRDQYYEERIRLLNEEEAMLTLPEPTHPEYLAMMQCVDARRDEKLRIIEAEYRLNQEALQRWAVAGRAQIMSQYYQDVRRTRENVLEELGDEWYRIQQKRRFHANSVADFSLRYPDTRAKALRQAVAYNKEVSILSGIAKHRGFPGAPEIASATLAEIEDDLDEIAQARRVGHHTGAVAATFQDYGAIPNERILGPAGAEFLKQTPWANPNHPAHQLPRPVDKNSGGGHSNSAVSAPPPYRHTSTSKTAEYPNSNSTFDGAPRRSPNSQHPTLVLAADAAS